MPTVFVALQLLKCVASAKTQPYSSICIQLLKKLSQCLAILESLT